MRKAEKQSEFLDVFFNKEDRRAPPSLPFCVNEAYGTPSEKSKIEKPSSIGIIHILSVLYV